MNYTKSRFDPFKSEDEIRYLTPGEQIEFSNNYRPRDETLDVTWDGGKTFEPFT